MEISGAEGFLPEHLDSLERVFVQFLADERQLRQHVVRGRDDVAADGVGLVWDCVTWPFW